MPPRLDAQIDGLYQLPLDEFTAARNSHAKSSGAAAAEIRALQKPPIAAWAINQVYWRGRPAFHALKAAAAALGAAHTAVVTGKKADLRAAGKAHEDALEAVAKLAIAILRDAGQPATDATRQAITTTLRALPASTDPPGRLTQVLQPTGFELLAGLPAAVSLGQARLAAAPAPAPAPAQAEGKAKAKAKEKDKKDAPREKAVARAKEAVAAAVRAERTAEQNARREEFEAARTTREAERAASDLAKARQALEAAQEAVEIAERNAEAATRKKEAAARRVRETTESLAAARVRTEAAQAALTRA
jgi:hypothetical protein